MQIASILNLLTLSVLSQMGSVKFEIKWDVKSKYVFRNKCGNQYDALAQE